MVYLRLCCCAWIFYSCTNPLMYVSPFTCASRLSFFRFLLGYILLSYGLHSLCVCPLSLVIAAWAAFTSYLGLYIHCMKVSSVSRSRSLTVGGFGLPRDLLDILTVTVMVAFPFVFGKRPWPLFVAYLGSCCRQLRRWCTYMPLLVSFSALLSFRMLCRQI